MAFRPPPSRRLRRLGGGDGKNRIDRSLATTGGHDRGDLILERSAARLRECLREEDILVRYGGDEFVVVLPRIARTPIVCMKNALDQNLIPNSYALRFVKSRLE